MEETHKAPLTAIKKILGRALLIHEDLGTILVLCYSESVKVAILF